MVPSTQSPSSRWRSCAIIYNRTVHMDRMKCKRSRFLSFHKFYLNTNNHKRQITFSQRKIISSSPSVRSCSMSCCQLSQLKYINKCSCRFVGRPVYLSLCGIRLFSLGCRSSSTMASIISWSVVCKPFQSLQSKNRKSNQNMVVVRFDAVRTYFSSGRAHISA